MRYLLVLLIVSLTTADVSGWTLSFAPGLSVKNAVIYLTLLALAARFVVRGGLRMELPKVQLWFGLLIAYATLSWLAAGLLLEYKSYTLMASGIDLKGNLLDNAMVFALCLYGTRTLEDARFVLKCALLAVAAANAIAIGNAAGLFQVGITTVGIAGNLAGRVYGAFGHANETAALIVCLLPAYVAAVYSAGSVVGRVFWAAGGVVSATLLLMSGSRGGFVALALGSLLASYVCRRIVSWRRAVIVAVILAAVAIPVIAFVSIRFGDILGARVLEMLESPGTSSEERTFIWRPVVERMMGSPVTLITGFGWGTYDVMGFLFAAHNQYLLLWFELGITGLACYLMLTRELVLTARRAAENAADEVARYLIAFIYGILALSVALFFTVLSKPWLYLWIYFGLMMRMSVIALQTSTGRAREVRQSAGAVAGHTHPSRGTQVASRSSPRKSAGA